MEGDGRKIAGNAKLSDAQRSEICEKYLAGETIREIAKVYGVCNATVSLTLKKKNVRRKTPITTRKAGLTEFTKRAKSVLWRQDQDRVHKTYERWKDRVAELESKDGAGLTKDQAIVRASKEFLCLRQLFREYDVRRFDPNPESHATVKHYGENAVEEKDILNEGKELCYRDNLAWAVEAAGAWLRTGELPGVIPNDSAYYLFKQACDSQKEFMARLGQVESKDSSESEAKRQVRKGGEKSIKEIDLMLAELEPGNQQTEESEND